MAVVADLRPLPLAALVLVVAGFIEVESVASLSDGLLALHSKSRRSSTSLRRVCVCVCVRGGRYNNIIMMCVSVLYE